MGVPLNLKDIQSGFLTASAFNANNNLLEEALDRALDRKGSSDNAMEVDMDMGLHHISNLRAAFLGHQAVNLDQIRDIIAALTSDVTSVNDIEDRVFATPGQQEIELQIITYLPGTNSLMVFKNGEYQRAVFEYTEVDNNTISFNTPLQGGDVVDIFGARFDAEFFAELAGDSASGASQAAQDAADAAADAIAAAGYKLGINNQSGITYTLEEEDEGDLVRMDNAGENTVIIPPASSVDFEIGTIVLVRQIGEGQTTVVGDTGVTVNAPNGDFTIVEQDFGVGIVKVDTNTWDMVKSFSGVPSEVLDALEASFDQRIEDAVAQFENTGSTITGLIENFEQGLAGFEQGLAGVASQNGYQNFPTGVRFAWGFVSGEQTVPQFTFPNNIRTVNFTAPFPNEVFTVQTTPAAGQNNNTGIASISATGFEQVGEFITTVIGSEGSDMYHVVWPPVYYLAIGR